MNELTQTFTTSLLPTVAGFIFGPVVTWASKRILGAVGSNIQPRTKVIMSAVAGGIAALGAGDPNAFSQAIVDFIQGVIAGFGGAKARDLIQGKTTVSVPGTQEAGTIPTAPVG